MKKTLVIGIGNILMTDDGLGIRAVEDMASRYVLPEEVELLDGGVAGLNLLPMMEGFEKIIVIDALIIDGARPGSIKTKVWRPDLKTSPTRGSAHGIGLCELLNMARLTGQKFNAIIVGMVPEKLCPGLELSETVERKLSALTKKVISKLTQEGYCVKERSANARKAHGSGRG